MVKSLVGLQKTNNISSLIARCNEGSPSASQFLTDSCQLLRKNLTVTLSYYLQTVLSRENKAHYDVAAYSHYSSALLALKEAKT